MGLNLGVNILTSGFLVTVLIFLAAMGILFVSASAKIEEVMIAGDARTNDQKQLKSAFDAVRIAYVLSFIAARFALLLAILYAGHETVISPSEYWHLALYLITYVLWIIAMIYAYIALDKVYDIRISTRNGADAYIWAGMLMAIFAFIGLTATGSGRLGMNIMRSRATDRVNQAESKINEHLPAIRTQVETHLGDIRQDVSQVKSKVGEIHEAAGLSSTGIPLQEMPAGAQTVSQMNMMPPPISRPPITGPPMVRSSLAAGSLASGQ